MAQHSGPPGAHRVAIRSLALTAVVGRAFLELENTGEAYYGAAHDRLLAWTRELALADELEPAEQEFIDTPVGGLGRQRMVDATWHTEGLGVLTWALCRLPAVPPPDEPFDVNRLREITGLVAPEVSRQLLAAAALRRPDELERMAARLSAVHWRVGQCTRLRSPLDAAGRARWSGTDLAGLPLADGDLAVGGEPIHRAPARLVGLIGSSARERHRAARWLLGDQPQYSLTDVST